MPTRRFIIVCASVLYALLTITPSALAQIQPQPVDPYFLLRRGRQIEWCSNFEIAMALGGEVKNECDNANIRVTAIGENSDGDTVEEPVETGESSKDKGIEDCDNFVAVKKTGSGENPGDYTFYWATINDLQKAVVRCDGKGGNGEWDTVVTGDEMSEEDFQKYKERFWDNHD